MTRSRQAWVRAASQARSALLAANPRVVMLSGPVSAEDQTYFRHASRDVLAHCTIPKALRAIGLAHVYVVDVAQTKCWLDLACEADLVLINLHGSPGEDGAIQGALDCCEVPYVGAGVEASAVALNKHLAKVLVSAGGVPTPKWHVVQDGRTVFGAPVRGRTIEKPLRGGSSIGARVSDSSAQSASPLSGAWLIEEFVSGTDVTVTVLDTPRGAVSLPAITLSHGDDFYSETVKFGAQWTRGVIAERPAHLGAQLAVCEEYAVRCHEMIGARDVSRTDFVVTSEPESPLFLELNTMPGLSEVSNAAECAYRAGLHYADLISLIVAQGLARA